MVEQVWVREVDVTEKRQKYDEIYSVLANMYSIHGC